MKTIIVLLFLILLVLLVGPIGFAVIGVAGVGALGIMVAHTWPLILLVVAIVIGMKIIAATRPVTGARERSGWESEDVEQRFDGWYAIIGGWSFGPWSDRATAAGVLAVELRRIGR